MKKRIKLLLIILWMCLIFYFSHQNGYDSSELSDGLLFNILALFINNEELIIYYLDIFATPIRKLAHFSEYAILAFLIINYIKEYKKIDKYSLILTFIICILYACSDEIHQLFIPNRAGSIIDVFIDSSGSLFMIFIYSLWHIKFQ